MSADWQRKVLCRYYMMGVCQKGEGCPYSHDRSISNKGTVPCRFYQAGTCANGSNCRFSHGAVEEGPIEQLAVTVESFSFEQSDGSEASYDPSFVSYEETNGLDGGLLVEAGSGYLESEAGSYQDQEGGGVYVEQEGVVEYVDHEGGGGYLEQEGGTPYLEPEVYLEPSPFYPAMSPTYYSAGEVAYPPSSPASSQASGSILVTVVGGQGSLSPQAVDPPHLTPLPGSAPWAPPSNWAEAAEFVPKPLKPRSWAQVVNSNVAAYPGSELSTAEAESAICPFYKVGECRYGEGCAYIHGETCDYCGQACLHPTHLDQRRDHLAECLQEHERNMELSFAVARSKEKTCGICMEVVLDKPKGEARFGILPACNHCFCLPCIRKWRQAKQFEHKIIRACPECRQTSDYICPSRFWVETPEEKGRLLADYKQNLGQKECKYFNKGSGECPFGNKCFYQHADKDGRTVDVGPPKKPLRRTNADGNLTLVQRLLLYDFLEERDGQLVLPLDFVELLDLYSDSDDFSDSDDAN